MSFNINHGFPPKADPPLAETRIKKRITDYTEKIKEKHRAISLCFSCLIGGSLTSTASRLGRPKWRLWFVLIIFFMLFPVFGSAETYTLSSNLHNEGIMGVGMRAMGMAGAFVHIADENPIYYNPAALLQIANYKLTNNCAFFISGEYLFTNSLTVRATDKLFFSWTGTNDRTIGHTLAGGYALPFGKFFSLGFTGKGILKEDAVGLGCDVGLLGKFSLVSCGVMVQDLFTRIGEGLRPMNIKFGVGIEPVQWIGINFQGDLNEVIEQQSISFKTTLRIGAEGRFFNNLLGIRAGYANFPPDQFSLTGGIGLGSGHISFNYAYVGSWEGGRNIDNAHWISAKFFFWPKSPEEIEREKAEKEKREKEEKERKLKEAKKGIEKESGKKEKEGETKEGESERPLGKNEFSNIYSDLEKTRSELFDARLDLEKMKINSAQMEKELSGLKAELEKIRNLSTTNIVSPPPSTSSPPVAQAPAPAEEKKASVESVFSLEELRNKLPSEVWARNVAGGIAIVISGEVFFPRKSKTISPASYPILDKITSLIANTPKYKINVEGYTDNTGKESFNILFSISRAKDIADYMMNRGLPKERFVIINGYGSKNPIASNLTESGRSSNRRVEIVVYE